jgi:hypothetical protein
MHAETLIIDRNFSLTLRTKVEVIHRLGALGG